MIRDETTLKALKTLTDEVLSMSHKITTLETEVKSTREIVEAWGAIKNAGKFIKWLGAIVAALTAIIVSAKLGVQLGIQHVFGSVK